MQNILITDIGYGDTKYAFEKGGKLVLGKIPTAVVRVGREKSSDFDGMNTVSRELVYNGTRYVVGKEALKEGIPLSTRRKDFIPTYAPLIVAKVFQEAQTDFAFIVISVAVSDFSREHKEQIKKSLSEFTVNGKPYKFQKIYVFPQGYGIYRDVFPKEKEGLVVVADVGFNTIDISVYENGKPLKEKLMGFPGYGSSRMIQNLVEKASEEVGEPVGELEINQAVQGNGKLRIYRREVDISDWVEEEKEAYAEEVLTMIESSPIGRAWKKADARIIGGGGGYFIPAEVKKEFGIIVPDRPEFSNVRGFANILKEGKDE